MSRVYNNNYWFLCTQSRKKAIKWVKKEEEIYVTIGRGKKNFISLGNINPTEFQMIPLENGKYITNDNLFFYYIKERWKSDKLTNLKERILLFDKSKIEELETLQYKYLNKKNNINYKKIKKGNKKWETQEEKIEQILQFY